MRDSGCAPMDRSSGSILGRSPLVQTSFPELGFPLFSDFWYNLMLYAALSDYMPRYEARYAYNPCTQKVRNFQFLRNVIFM